MNDDTEHLRRYAASGSEDDFAALVQRNLPLVYAAALRRVGGDVHRAQDVAQAVFTAVARNARALVRHPDLTGWLFTTTRFLAAKAVRGEQRRQSRELEAGLVSDAMNEPVNESSGALHAVLDDVMMELRQLDRQVILLRFHRGLRLAEIGVQLGATENAVQKRIERALEQLREKLARRGITSTAAALALAFEQQTAVALPAGLAAAATTAGLACGAGGGGLLAMTSFMAVSKLQIGLGASVVVAATAGLVWQVQENATLRAEVAQHAAATHGKAADLESKLAALTQRAEAAEADAAKLSGALQSAKSAQATATGRPRTLTDSQTQAKEALNRAGKLAAEGKHQEAVEEYLKLYHELAGKRGTTYQQMAMSGLQNLGRNYPPALAALRQLRDAAVEKLRTHPPEAQQVVAEIGLLNERLGDGQATMALYDTLPVGDPGRQALGNIGHNAFVQARRYADALVGKSFGNMLNELEMGMRFSSGQTGQSLTNSRTFAVQGTLTNIEVLTGAGQLEDARALTEKLLAFDNSEATRAAIQRHVERAKQPAKPQP